MGTHRLAFDVIQAYQRDQTAARDAIPGLLVDIQSWPGVSHDDPFLFPPLQEPARVAEAGLVITGQGPEITAHQVSDIKLVNVAYFTSILRLANPCWADQVSQQLVKVGAVMQGS